MASSLVLTGSRSREPLSPLLDRVGNPVRMVTTATDGRFRFTDVQPGRTPLLRTQSRSRRECATSRWVGPAAGLWWMASRRTHDLDELEDRPGAELVDFERGRVKPRRSLDLTFSQRVRRTAGAELSFRLSLLKVINTRWAYNFGNPFSGTHFGPGRTVQVGLRAGF
jgi:hypothetical protein